MRGRKKIISLFEKASGHITELGSQQARESFEECVLLLRVHGLVGIQLQGECGVARCQCS